MRCIQWASINSSTQPSNHSPTHLQGGAWKPAHSHASTLPQENWWINRYQLFTRILPSTRFVVRGRGCWRFCWGGAKSSSCRGVNLSACDVWGQFGWASKETRALYLSCKHMCSANYAAYYLKRIPPPSKSPLFNSEAPPLPPALVLSCQDGIKSWLSLTSFNVASFPAAVSG